MPRWALDLRRSPYTPECLSRLQLFMMDRERTPEMTQLQAPETREPVGGALGDVAILTCNRRRLLHRCLSSLPLAVTGQPAALGARVRILDDSTRSSPDHIRASDRQVIARLLSAAAGVDRTLVTFALCGMRSAGPPIGALRNTALILNAGRRHVQLDDDAICQPYVRSDANERHVILARESADVALRWYGDSPAQFGDLRASRDGFLQAHDRILGRSLADLTRENSFGVGSGVALPDGRHAQEIAAMRVRLSQNSLVGDCGVTGPWWKALRARVATTHHYRSELLSREVLRTVQAIAVSRDLAVTAFAMGIDGTRIVPPFLPCGRGEDALFAYLLKRIDQYACQAQLPAILEHRPEPRPRFDYTEIVSSITHVSIPSLISSLCSDESSASWREATVASLGARLLDLFRTGWRGASEELMARVDARRRELLGQLQSAIDATRDDELDRRADMRLQANALVIAINHASPRALAADIAALQPQLADETAIVRLLQQFGELLLVWSRLWETASEAQFRVRLEAALRPARRK